MADKKISALVSLAGKDVAATDLFPVVDVNVAETKSLTRDELRNAVNAIQFAATKALATTAAASLPDDTIIEVAADESLSDARTRYTVAAGALVFSYGVVTKAALDAQNSYPSPTDLYRSLADPMLPLPSFFHGWALNGFHGVTHESVTAPGIPLDSIGQPLLEYVVTGASGASILTIVSGDQSKGTGRWGAVIEHDDGTLGSYGITNLTGGVCTVFPNLRSAVTAKPMCNLGGPNLGQHYTERGYRKLARNLFDATKSDGYRLKIAAAWLPDEGRVSDWTYVGGATVNHANIDAMNATVAAGSRATGAPFAVSSWFYSLTAAPPFSGKGVSKTFQLGGASGFAELFVSRVSPSGADVGFLSWRLLLKFDGVTALDNTYTENSGLQRIVVPFTSAAQAEVTITMADELGDFPNHSLIIDQVRFWAYDRVNSTTVWSDKIINKNSKTVVLGDSWTTYYATTPGGSDGAFVRELQSLMTAAGGTGVVVGVGTAGTTAEYGLTEFDLKVAPQAPEQVVINYAVNDLNSFGAGNYGRWLTAMYKLGRKCQAIGARPIFIMPLPTQSESQVQGLGNWATKIARGLK